MADFSASSPIGTGMPSTQELLNKRQLMEQQKEMQQQMEMLMQQHIEMQGKMAAEMADRGRQTEHAAMPPVTEPTPQEAAQINGFLNQTLGHMEYFKGQNFTMPKPREAGLPQ